MYTEKTVQDFVAELASPAPVPGGGGAAALGGALGAALVSMVCRLTVGKEKYAAVQGEIEEILGRAEELRQDLVAAIEADAQAYGRLAAAFKMPRATDEEKEARAAAVQSALVEATEVPLNIARLCAAVMDLCPATAAKGNVAAVSDAGVAVLLAEAGLHGALLNVKINLSSLKDAALAESVRRRMAEYVAGKEQLRQQVLQEVEAKL